MTDEPELDLEPTEADDEDDDAAEQVDSEEFDQANEADVIEQRTPVPGSDEDYDS
jgi:hypothetical protein